MYDAAVLVCAAIAAIGTIIMVLPVFGFDLRIKGRSAMTEINVAKGPTKKAGIALALAILSLCLTGYSAYQQAFKNKFTWRNIPKGQLTLVHDQTFISKEVPLDGMEYEHCKFINVTFVYNGTAEMAFHENEIYANPLSTSTDNPAVFSTQIMLKGLGALKEPFNLVHLVEM